MIGMSDDWTVERHLKDKPADVVALYERFIDIATRCGPFTYAVAKTAITLKGSRRGFAGAAPGASRLDGYFDLQRQVDGPQIRRSSPYTKKLFVHARSAYFRGHPSTPAPERCSARRPPR
jgi:hypothetical protein